MKAKQTQKCQNCGGSFKFDPKTNSVKCQNCGTVLPTPVNPAKNLDFLKAEVRENSNEWGGATHSYKCKSCGAVQVYNKGDMADVCPFCGSPNVIDFEVDSLLSPNAILPFMISEEQAMELIKSKIKSSFWAPKGLLSSITLERLNGIYTPTYTFDFVVAGTFKGRIGRNVERTIRLYDGSLKTVTELKWQNISGNVNQMFDDLIVDAGQIVDGAVLKHLEPFDTNSAIEFNQNFLFGYVANKSTKKIAVAKDQAEQIALDQLKQRITEQFHADQVEYIDFNVLFNNVTYKYTLLPVYITNFKYGKKEYKMYANGATGKVYGKLPKSKGKIWFFAVFGILFVVALVLLINLT